MSKNNFDIQRPQYIFVVTFNGNGGTQEYAMMLAKHATLYGDVTIAGPVAGPLQNYANAIGAKFIEISGRTCTDINARSLLRRSKGSLELINCLKSQMLQRRRYSVIHLNLNPISFGVVTLFLKGKIVFANTFHDFGNLEKRSIMYWANSLLLNLSRMRKTLIFVPSRFICNELLTKVAKLPRRAITPIPTGISPPTQTNKRAKNPFGSSSAIKFGMVGRVSEAKAPNIWVEAARVVLDHGYEEISFHWFGGNDATLAALQYPTSNQNNIVFHGPFVEAEDVYAEIDVLLFSSAWEGGCPPRVILEAMFRSIPCILPALPTICEALGNKKCLYYKPRDANHCAKQIIYALSNAEELEDYSKEALKHVRQHHTSEIEAEKTFQSYHSVLKVN